MSNPRRPTRNHSGGGPSPPQGPLLVLASPQQRPRHGPTLTNSQATTSQSSSTTQEDAAFFSAQQADERAKALEEQLAALEASGTAAAGGTGGKTKKSPFSTSATTTTRRDEANTLRVQICELLADLILTDPVRASRAHAVERMWRKCFYARIAHLRAKLAKKTKPQQPQHPQPQPLQQTRNTSDSSLHALEQHLVLFLGEAITLYEYLVEKLQEKLEANVAEAQPRSNRNNSTGEEEDDGDEYDNDEQGCATVECLHRLYICLGDLHRYTATATATATANSKAPSPRTATTTRTSAASAAVAPVNKAAETSYLMSAKLGPGMGHPANQLGVMCGLQIFSSSTSSPSPANQLPPQLPVPNNQSAVGLYWYARALLASKDPFETTFVNLQRLFQANALWLERHRRKFEDGAAAPANTTSLFLAKFVEFHGKLLTDESFVGVAVVTAINEVAHGLSDLLRQSAISDSLLVKLVAIQAFTESYRSDAAPASVPRTVEVVPREVLGVSPRRAAREAESLRVAFRRIWGRVSTLRMGTGMADRIVVTLQQRSQSHNQQQKQVPPTTGVPAVRLLLPLLLLTEYLHRTTAEVESTIRENRGAISPDLADLYRSCTRDFWERLVPIWNWIGTVLPAPVVDAAAAAAAAAAGSGATVAAPGTSNVPAEYMSLRGFTPFASFIPQGKDSGFLSPRRAVQVLQEERASSSSSTAVPAAGGGVITGLSVDTVGGNNGKPSQESNRVKLAARLWTVGHQLALDDSSASLRGFQRNGERRFAYESPAVDDPQPMDETVASHRNSRATDYKEDADEDDGGDTLNVFQEDDTVRADDEVAKGPSGGVLVYKTVGAGGPALLVPGTLLVNASSAEDTVLNRTCPTPAQAVPAPREEQGLTGLDLGWMNDQNPQQPATGTVDQTNDSMDVDSTSLAGVTRPHEPQATDLFAEHRPGAVAESVVNTPSATDSARSSTVLPPPGFGTLAGHSVPAYNQFTFLDVAIPPPPTELTLLEASGHLFGPPPPTANPFVNVSGAAYSFAPPSVQDGDAGQQTPSLFPHRNPDSLWMIQDVLGGDENFETSLLDSGLLNSLMNDDTSAPTKNPFAT